MNPLKYTVRRHSDHTWHIEPHMFDPWIHRGPYPRWRDAYDAALTASILSGFRHVAVSEEGFHVDNP